MKLEFAIAGSPTDAFFSQIAMFRMSLSALGGVYSAARVIAVFGDTAPSVIPVRWRKAFRDVDVIWVDPEDFRLQHFYAQGVGRFAAFSDDADITILSDADTLVMARFDGMLDKMLTRPAIRACPAYHPPQLRGEPVQWNALAEELQHPAAGRIDRPFYVNLGFFAGTPALFKDLIETIEHYRKRLMDVYGGDGDATFFGGQIAVTLAIHALGLPVARLPRRFNFSNSGPHARDFPDEFARLKICHYFNQTRIDRWKIFASKAGFDRFMKADLAAGNLALQDRVKALTGGEYPFPEQSVPVDRRFVIDPASRQDFHTLRRLYTGEVAGRRADGTHERTYFLGWARAMLSRHNPAEARAMCEAGLTTYPQDLELTRLLAAALMDTGQAGQAVDVLQHALEIHGPAPDLIVDLARAHAGAGNLDAALASLETGLKAWPGDSALNMEYGRMLARCEAYPQALAALEQALDTGADDAGLHTQIGEVLEALDRLPDALAARERAVELEPDNPALHEALGSLLARLNAPDRARRHLLKAVELEPKNPKALRKLSRLFEKTGRYREALKSMRQLAKLIPRTDAVNDRIKALKALCDAGPASSKRGETGEP